MKEVDEIFIFNNDNVIFFSKDGEQMPEVGHFKVIYRDHKYIRLERQK